jgi:hypothetical protein
VFSKPFLFAALDQLLGDEGAQLLLVKSGSATLIVRMRISGKTTALTLPWGGNTHDHGEFMFVTQRSLN